MTPVRKKAQTKRAPTTKGWVVRILTGRTRGWQARKPFGAVDKSTRSRRFRSKLFSDRMYGGSTKANAAAHKWLKTGAVQRPIKKGNK